MFIIRKEFHFSASHQLDQMPEGHPCKRLHGHNYVVVVELRSKTLNKYGFVKDYHDLDPIKKWIDETLDHQHLNSTLNSVPTAEIMAQKIFFIFMKDFPSLYAIEVMETPKTCARYERS